MFSKLTHSQTHIKAVWWGEPKTGKTVAALKGEAVAFLDLERGAEQYVNHFSVYAEQPKNFTGIESAVSFLMHQGHGFKTLVIDSASVAWSMCMEEMIQPDVKPDWITIKGRWKAFLRSLIVLPMDVILIGRAKDCKVEGKWWVKTGGKEADLENNTCHDFDFILFQFRQTDEQGIEHFRTRIDGARDLTGKIKAGMIFENFDFSQFKAMLQNIQTQEEQQQEKQPEEDLPVSDEALELTRATLRLRLSKMGMSGSRKATAFCSEVLRRSIQRIEDLDGYDIQDIFYALDTKAA
ncbi:MAG: AAA family ATPase [SAR324 cluster bacterium]|nr:AAA family ATPase [SAR324 cluster bacterium]